VSDVRLEISSNRVPINIDDLIYLTVEAALAKRKKVVEELVPPSFYIHRLNNSNTFTDYIE